MKTFTYILLLFISSSCVNDANKKSSKVELLPFKFVQMCDTQLGMGGYDHDKNAFKQAVKQINNLKPDFTVICGDLVNTPNEKSFNDFKKIKSLLTVPCYCAAGNHDVLNKPTTKSLKYYREVIGKDYYSVEHKGYTIIIVNTQLWKAPVKGETEKQHNWLKQTLQKAKSKNSPIFVVSHYPVFVRSPDEKENYFNLALPIRTELLSLYKQYGVIALLAGHTHKTISNEYKGIKMLNGETTSKNFDKRPLGFRLWTVTTPDDLKHEFIPLK